MMYLKKPFPKFVLGMYVLISGTFCMSAADIAPKNIKNNDIFKDNVRINTLLNEQQTVSGMVVDETGVPLPGASVLEKGTTNGSITDFDGNFIIDLAGSNAVLAVSYLGYTTQEVSLNGRTSITVQLEPDATQLEDVVVVGYGIQKKS
ncbi:MAG: hypothetical protein ACJAUQ_001183, partial [Maribacter sp.]